MSAWARDIFVSHVADICAQIFFRLFLSYACALQSSHEISRVVLEMPISTCIPDMHKTSPRHCDFAYVLYHCCNPFAHARPQDIGYRARDPRNLNRVIAEIKELKKKVLVYDSLQLRTIKFLICAAFCAAFLTELMRACRYMVFLSRLVWPFWFDSLCVDFLSLHRWPRAPRRARRSRRLSIRPSSALAATARSPSCAM